MGAAGVARAGASATLGVDADGDPRCDKLRIIVSSFCPRSVTVRSREDGVGCGGLICADGGAAVATVVGSRAGIDAGVGAKVSVAGSF